MPVQVSEGGFNVFLPVLETSEELCGPRVSASFRNPQKVAGLESTVFPRPSGRFLPESAPAFLPSSNLGQEPSRSARPTRDPLRQPSSRYRIDDPSSFWGSWISNRQVWSFFTPSLTQGQSGSASRHPAFGLRLRMLGRTVRLLIGTPTPPLTWSARGFFQFELPSQRSRFPTRPAHR